MSDDPAKSPPLLPFIEDFDLRSSEIGPAARLMRIEADPEGGIYYQFDRRQPRCLQLPPAFALRPLGMIDQTYSAAFCDMKSNRLQALAIYAGVGTRLFLFGRDWGTWLDDDGRTHRSAECTSIIRQLGTPVDLQESKQLIILDLTINIYNRHAFSHQAVRSFREERNLRHSLNLMFRYPEGDFVTSRLVVQDSATGQTRYVFDFTDFPIRWPELPGARKKTTARRKRPSAPAEPAAQALGAQAQRAASRDRAPSDGSRAQAGTSSKRTAKDESPRWPWPPEREPENHSPLATPTGQKRPTIPETTHLSTHELIAMLSTENDAERRWHMIEPNLMQGRPERTYPLISKHADQIADKVRSWPVARLKVAFAAQPGAVLVGLMLHWKVNQVLAVAEVNAEAGRILEWLRDREIDRLLKIELGDEPVTAKTAREVLNLDARADGIAIKKSWRTLLGFLNADLGRSVERAIHRRKDEIARHLHVARDILLKKNI